MSYTASLLRPALSVRSRIVATTANSTTLFKIERSSLRFFATKSNKNSPPNETLVAPSKTLELLKKTLEDKRKKLKEILDRQAPETTVIAAGSALDITPPEDNTENNDTGSAPVKKVQDRTIPLFASPADMSIRLPKVTRDFDQPDNAEIAKIAIIGSPNVGKSTLVNDLVRSTVSIVSVRPHTTRERIKAVMTHENKQIVFYDTPGVVPEKNISRLSRDLVTSSWKAIEDADHLLVVLDCNKLLEHSLITESYIFERLGKSDIKIPSTLVFNKMDLIKGREAKLQEFVERYSQQFPNFIKTIYTSAQPPKVGIQELRSHLLSLTQPGEWLYPAEQKSDQADLSRVEDLIRAELFAILKVPYSVKQVNVGWTEVEDNILRIDQNLVVDRAGLKKIIVGTNGAVIRDITLNARQQIGKALQRRVMLNLQVKVKSN
ncbi:Era Like 12S Mitochondrial RRNA Chaperone 1 [Entomortierella beljakovae]|nr:Era Like 12S Mitochondrial RRNA Chaperone 1 [Entomortierella beljakovae]